MSKEKFDFSELITHINSSNRIIVVSHFNPDSDAYGSALGISLALESLSKEVQCVNESGIVDRYKFIPGIEKVQNSFPEDEWDLLIICDCGDKKRLGDSFLKTFPKVKKTVNIDHHQSNSGFADINYVYPNIASTCEIVFEILSEMNFTLTKDIANCLLAGIMGDTGSFRYSNVTGRTFEIASALLKSGGSTSEIAGAMYSNKPYVEFKFENEAFSDLKLYENGQVAGLVVKKDLMKKHNCDGTNTEGFVERARDIEGVKISFLLREDLDKLKVSLRSMNEKINVAEIAKKFGGGGHIQAAAFRYSGVIDELLEKLLVEIKTTLLNS